MEPTANASVKTEAGISLRLSSMLRTSLPQAMLFIDDAHKLTGRKAQIARKCLISAKLWIMTASEEGRLPASIRPIVERRDPQRTNLESDVSYDTTKALIWFLVAMCVVAGAWEAGAVIGGLQMLGSGRRSTRAD